MGKWRKQKIVFQSVGRILSDHQTVSTLLFLGALTYLFNFTDSMTPPRSNVPGFSRLWILIPILCAVCYMLLNTVHLQLYSMIRHVYSEHFVHLSFLGLSPGTIASQKTSQILLTPPDNLNGLQPFTRHIVAVGDLHGDLPNALRVLRFSKVIDNVGNWSGAVDFFVQTGDIIDR